MRQYGAVTENLLNNQTQLCGKKYFATTKQSPRLIVRKTYEKSSSAIVCRGARCCLFYSGASLGLSLPWTVLPLLLPRPLLPISLSRALLSAPWLGRRHPWAPRILSLLVSGLLPAPRSPFAEIARVLCAELAAHLKRSGLQKLELHLGSPEVITVVPAVCPYHACRAGTVGLPG